jgi:hypothetical protein
MKRVFDFPRKLHLHFLKNQSGERHAHLTLFYCSPHAHHVALQDAHLLFTETAKNLSFIIV